MGDMVMTINLKDYEDTIKSLVWKFRNLGFADMLYAPVIDTGSEAIAETKMANVAEGSEEKKSFRFTVTNFEDLLSEGYVVFTELKNQFESMGIYCDNCKDKCPFYFQMQEVVFEQALVKRLEGHFLNLYKGLNVDKRSASLRFLEDGDEDKIVNLSRNFYDKLHYAYIHNTIPEHLRQLAKDVLEGNVDRDAKGGITKRSLRAYLHKLGWKESEIRHTLYKKVV
jgi:hypothetical protein